MNADWIFIIFTLLFGAPFIVITIVISIIADKRITKDACKNSFLKKEKNFIYRILYKCNLIINTHFNMEICANNADYNISILKHDNTFTLTVTCIKSNNQQVFKRFKRWKDFKKELYGIKNLGLYVKKQLYLTKIEDLNCDFVN